MTAHPIPHIHNLYRPKPKAASARIAICSMARDSSRRKCMGVTSSRGGLRSSGAVEYGLGTCRYKSTVKSTAGVASGPRETYHQSTWAFQSPQGDQVDSAAPSERRSFGGAGVALPIHPQESFGRAARGSTSRKVASRPADDAFILCGTRPPARASTHAAAPERGCTGRPTRYCGLPVLGLTRGNVSAGRG